MVVAIDGNGTRIAPARTPKPVADTDNKADRGSRADTGSRPDTKPSRRRTDAADGAVLVGTKKNFVTAAVDQGKKLVVAHRGNHEQSDSPRVENTIEALRRADRDGASDVVEIDFRKLGDGTVVVYHDPALHGGPKDGKRLSDLSKGDLADYPEIPTLDEFAKEAKDLDVNIMAEIKETGYEREVIDGLLAHVPRERLSAMSFEKDAVRAIDEAYPEIPVGFLPRQSGDDLGKKALGFLTGSSADQVDSLGFKPDFVEASGGDVNERLLDYLGDRGIPLIAGGTSADNKVQLLDDDRVLGIMTNDPSALPALRDATYDPGEHGSIPEGREGFDIYDATPGQVDKVVRGAIEGVSTFVKGDPAAKLKDAVGKAWDLSPVGGVVNEVTDGDDMPFVPFM